MKRIKETEINKGDYVKIIYDEGYRIYLALESFGGKENTYEHAIKFKIIKNGGKLVGHGEIGQYDIGDIGHWETEDLEIYKLTEDEAFLSMI